MSTESVVLRMAVAAERFAIPIERACAEFGIASERAKSHFIGQLAHESGDFRIMRESLNYAADRLVPTFGAHRITHAQAQALGRTDTRPANQRGIANVVYGGRWGRENLGNVEIDDGWRFRGTGLIQLTGRDNFRRASQALFGDARLLDDPDRLAEPEIAARAAAWFFAVDKRLIPWAELDDLLAVSRGINLGNPRSKAMPHGLEDRRVKTEKARRLFQQMRGVA